MTDLSNWKLTIENGVAVLAINRPTKKNAFNPQVVEEMYQLLLELEKNPTVRVLVITTLMNEMFCSGADIEWFYNLGEAEGRQVSIRSQEAFGKLEMLPFPVISAIKGLCLTAGLELSLCCDMIIAADNAQIGQIELKYGLTPGGGGTQRLTRLIGPMKTKEFIFTAKIIPAAEALAIGLVNEVVPLDKFDERIKAICATIMKASPQSLKEAKTLVNQAVVIPHEGFQYENKVFGECFGSGEPHRRFEKFVTKQK